MLSALMLIENEFPGLLGENGETALAQKLREERIFTKKSTVTNAEGIRENCSLD